MGTQKIVQDIINYFENSIMFRPNMTPQGLGTPTQLKRALKIDIANTKPTDQDGYKLYELDDIEQAYEIISGVYGKQQEEIKPEVDSFLRKHNVDPSKPLYLVAYLEEVTKEN